jgi:hypothetical protein
VPPKSNTLKIAQLLAQFLYTRNKLSIQGLGTFILDTSANIETESGRSGKSEMQGQISFENDSSVKTDPGLIEFIASQTGKMMPLAAADLESHLGLAQQFLNIGKAFLFEGIGTLSKSMDGSHQFTQGSLFTEKTSSGASGKESNGEVEKAFDYSMFHKEYKKFSWRKPLIGLFILAGIALIVWGGYYVYKKNVSKEKVVVEQKNKEPETTPVKDSITAGDTTKVKSDTAVQVKPVQQAIENGKYKFILETSKAQRAFTRFAKLKTYGWNVQMETKDSVSYKLFVSIPVSLPADTTRLMDSLTVLTGRKVRIEN